MHSPAGTLRLARPTYTPLPFQISISCRKAGLSPHLPSGPRLRCMHTQSPSQLPGASRPDLSWPLVSGPGTGCPLSPCPARTVWLVPISSWRPQKKKAERWSAVGRLADGGSPGRPGRAWFHRRAPVLRSRNRIWDGGDSMGRHRWGLHRPRGPSQASPVGAAPQRQPGCLAKAPLVLPQPPSAAPSAVPTTVPQLRTTGGPERMSQPVCQRRFRFQ